MTGTDPHHNLEPPQGDHSTPPHRPREITSQELLRGEREVLISHGDQLYRLKLTRSGKLILHK